MGVKPCRCLTSNNKKKPKLDFGPASPRNWMPRLKGKSKPTCGDCRGFVSSCVAVIQIRRACVCVVFSLRFNPRALQAWFGQHLLLLLLPPLTCQSVHSTRTSSPLPNFSQVASPINRHPHSSTFPPRASPH